MIFSRNRSLAPLSITSKANDDLESLITPEKELQEPLVDHIKTLCLTKLNVTLPVEDIRTCHYLPDGSIKLSLANLRPNSAFEQMVTGPRSRSQTWSAASLTSISTLL